MKTSKTRQASISDFKAHCTAYLKEVETGAVEYSITKHGKTIAIAKAPDPEKTTSLADWIGAGKGTVTFAPGYDPHAPAFDDDEWEMNRGD